MDKKASNFFLRLIFAIILIFLLIVIGYLVGGIMGYPKFIGYEVSVEESIVAVLSDPFSDWSNEFTPVTITLALVIGEFITFIVMAITAKKNQQEDLSEMETSEFGSQSEICEDVEAEENEELKKQPEVIDEIESDIEEKLVEESTSPTAQSLFNDIFSIDNSDEKESSSDKDDYLENSDEAEENEVDGINDGLLELTDEYSLEQLKAMSQIYSYLPDITAKEIKKMFGPDKSAEEINEYIEVLFE